MSADTPLILLVEDDTTIRKVFRYILTQENYRVQEAPNARVALHKITFEVPDLFLIDLRLPDISGMELAIQLRNHVGTKDRPLIGVSGLVSLLEDAQQYKSYFDELLFKPVEPQELRSVVGKYLNFSFKTNTPTKKLGKGAQLFVIEDRMLQFKWMQQILQNHGFRVEGVTGGLQALTHTWNPIPDAIICNVLLSDMDGFQLCYELRQRKELQNVPIFLITSYNNSSEAQHLALQVGVTKLITKTATCDKLVVALMSELFPQDVFMHPFLEQPSSAPQQESDLESTNPLPPPNPLPIPFWVLELEHAEEQHGTQGDPTVEDYSLMATRLQVSQNVSTSVHSPWASQNKLPDTTGYKHRLLLQLEAQAIRVEELTRKLAFQSAQLSSLASFAELIPHITSLPHMLTESLARYLDAEAFHMVAVYLVENSNPHHISLHSYVGWPEARATELADCFGHPSLLKESMNLVDLMVFPSSHPASQPLLEKSGYSSLILAPLASGFSCMGVVLFASHAPDQQGYLATFARAIRTQLSLFVGNALSLSRLAVSEYRMRHVAETLSQGIVATDGDGIVQYLNPAAECILATPAQELSQTKLEDTFPSLAHLQENTHLELTLPSGKQAFLHIQNQHFRDPFGGIHQTLVIQDVTEQQQRLQKLSTEAQTDPLTGLLNRRYFLEQTQQFLEEASTSQDTHALFFWDLDHFKQVNDTLGHKAGDLLLKEIANILVFNLRQSDWIGRLGGDEFVTFCPRIQETQALSLVQKLLDALRPVFAELPLQSPRCGVSVGIAMYPNHGQRIETLLKNADQAMYQAKKSGKGRLFVYTPPSSTDNDR